MAEKAKKKIKIGILLCEKHCNKCHGLKCFRALNDREGAFAPYKDVDLELVSYCSCTGCNASAGNKVFVEWQKAGIELAFFSTGFHCAYPPCPHLKYLRDLAEKSYGLKVVMGTHPIDSNFWASHNAVGSWDSELWREAIKGVTTDEKTRQAYTSFTKPKSS
jgi:predicted metal-binding protein